MSPRVRGVNHNQKNYKKINTNRMDDMGYNWNCSFAPGQVEDLGALHKMLSDAEQLRTEEERQLLGKLVSLSWQTRFKVSTLLNADRLIAEPSPSPRLACLYIHTLFSHQSCRRSHRAQLPRTMGRSKTAASGSMRRLRPPLKPSRWVTLGSGQSLPDWHRGVFSKESGHCQTGTEGRVYSNKSCSAPPLTFIAGDDAQQSEKPPHCRPGSYTATCTCTHTRRRSGPECAWLPRSREPASPTSLRNGSAAACTSPPSQASWTSVASSSRQLRQ